MCVDSQAMKSSNATIKNPVVVGVILLLSWILRYYLSSNLPLVPSHTASDEFNAHNARNHLKNMTSLGPRVTGTKILEIDATRVLVNALNELKAAAPPEMTLEFEVQHPSSSFYLDFLGGLMNVYSNITNVVAKISWKDLPQEETRSILINSHYDTVSGSSGASDDAVGVACMLETIRAISNGPPLHHPIVFLFNGAEESLMQGAHGFITQHRWARDLQYIINLEAMGAGGKEMVFQCKSEWMASFYRNHARYPNANVLANEIFSNLLWRTAATDFRTFLSHGPSGLIGVDSAYTLNGYVYHTSFDSIDQVPGSLALTSHLIPLIDETLQHTGENLLSLATALSLNKDYPPRPSPSADRMPSNPHLPAPVTATQAIYFDLFAWSVVYTGYFTIIAIHSLVFLLGLYTAYQLFLSSPQQQSFVSYLVTSCWNEFYCLSLCLAAVVLVSVIYSLLIPMLWYSSGTLVAYLLYIPPTLITSVWIRSRFHQTYSQTQGVANILSMWLLFLAVSIISNLMIGYIACLYVVSIWSVFMFSKVLNNYMTHRAPVHGFDRSKLIHFFVFYSYELCQLPILYVWWCVFSPTFTLVIPLMGKVGTVIPSDVLVALLIGFGVSTGWNLLTVNVIPKSQTLASSKNLLLGYALMVICFFIALQPYSAAQPKRLWIQHIHRELHHPHPLPLPLLKEHSSKPPLTDHGLWVSGFDATGLDPIIPFLESTPFHRNKFSLRLGNMLSPDSPLDYSCNGFSGDCYFRYPYSFPVAEALQDFVFIPYDKPPEMMQYPNKLTLDLSVLSVTPILREELPERQSLRSLPQSSGLQKRIISVVVTGSSHMALVLRELPGSNLIRWSFPSDVDREVSSLKESEWQDSSLVNRPDGVYYIQIGFGMCPMDICKQRILLETIEESKDSKLEIAAYSHYMDGRDAPIQEFIKGLPEWSKGAEWSQYQSSLIVKYV